MDDDAKDDPMRDLQMRVGTLVQAVCDNLKDDVDAKGLKWRTGVLHTAADQCTTETGVRTFVQEMVVFRDFMLRVTKEDAHERLCELLIDVQAGTRALLELTG